MIGQFKQCEPTISNPDQDKSNFFLKNITQTFRRYYPNSIIYPVIGNHEGVPVNAFPSDNYWLYENMADAWEEFDLEEQAYQTIARFPAALHLLDGRNGLKAHFL